MNSSYWCLISCMNIGDYTHSCIRRIILIHLLHSCSVKNQFCTRGNKEIQDVCCQARTGRARHQRLCRTSSSRWSEITLTARELSWRKQSNITQLKHLTSRRERWHTFLRSEPCNQSQPIVVLHALGVLGTLHAAGALPLQIGQNDGMPEFSFTLALNYHIWSPWFCPPFMM